MGTWDYRADAALLKRGFEAGALFVDTAESYGTESVVGEAVASCPGRVFVATKVSPENFRNTDLRNSVEDSLRRLHLDTVDLLQLHQPNPTIPIEETMAAMVQLVDEGKVRFIGVSNFSISELQEARKVSGKHKIVSNQVRYSIIDRTIEEGLLDYCHKERITVIAYSPLGRDFGRIRDSDPLGIIDGIAKTLGKSLAQVVLSWCLSKDGVVVIPKGNSTAHILENCGASNWRLGEDQLRLLDTQVQYRRRNRVDVLLRCAVPPQLHRFAKGALRYLPRGIRRWIG